MLRSSRPAGVINRTAPPAPRRGKITTALRRSKAKLLRADQARFHMLGANVAGSRIIRRDMKRSMGSTPAVGGGGRVSDALRSAGRSLAQSDARYFRGAAATSSSSRSLGATGAGVPQLKPAKRKRR